MRNRRKKSKKKIQTKSLANISKPAEPELFFSIQIHYSYTVPKVAFLFLKLYQLAGRRYYQNVMRSIFNRKSRRSRKERVKAVYKKDEKELENQEKKEREKKASIRAHWHCFVMLIKQIVIVSQKQCYQEFKVSFCFCLSIFFVYMTIYVLVGV